MRPTISLALFLAISASCARNPVHYPLQTCGAHFCLEIQAPQTLASIGKPQSLDVRGDRIFVTGDGESGFIGEFQLAGSTLVPVGRVSLTLGGSDAIRHVTGLTEHDPYGTWIGNGYVGDLFHVDWEKLQQNGTLDGAILAHLVDGAAIDGSRPEFVRVGDRWLIASADYGNAGNDVRFYDPEVLSTAPNSNAPGVLVAKFPCTPFVQSLFYWEERDVLVLMQNWSYGKKWRLTFLDLPASIAAEKSVVLDVLEPPIPSELEGLQLVTGSSGVIVTGGTRNNAHTFVLTPVPPPRPQG